jgi:guanylate kinase
MKNDLNSPFQIRPTQPLLIVISGPSGVGKDSVVKCMEQRNLPFHFVVTATTRPPRENETPGVDYFFHSKDEFAGMIDRGELLEYALVYSDYKGIPKAQVQQALQSGKDVVMRLDVQGAATIRELCPDALLIFLTTQNEAELEDRLRARRSDKPQEINLRIATARQELKRVAEFDYVVANRDSKLDQTVDSIAAIIHAEHCRVDHRKVTL